MSDFKVTKQKELFSNLIDKDKHVINNDLLLTCIGVGSGNMWSDEHIMGFSTGKGFGYVLLTYFVSKALGFKRLPYCENRIYTDMVTNQTPGSGGNKQQAFKRIVSDLSECDIDLICDEIQVIYRHTQTYLKKAGITHVNLRREIKNYEYSKRVARLKISSDLLDLNTVQFEMDTLNSFGDEGCYKNSDGISLELKIPIKDVLYCNHLIGHLDNGCLKKNTIETGEWIIINRSSNGVVEIPTSSIKIEDGMWLDEKKDDINYAQSFMDAYNPVVLRSRFRIDPYLGLTDIKPTLKNKIIQKLLEVLLKPTE